MKQTAKLSIIGLIVSVFMLTFATPASAHVVVKPAEVVTASFQTFTVGVPNEKDIPTNNIKLLIPSGLKHVSPTQKPGWKVTIEQDSGDDAPVKSITWSNNTIGKGMRDDFTFSAQVPAQATNLQWKAYQTYSDGTVVAWDQESDGGHGDTNNNSGPFSVTKVVTETAQNEASKQMAQTATNAQHKANLAFYTAVAGVAVSLAGLYLTTRKK